MKIKRIFLVITCIILSGWLNYGRAQQGIGGGSCPSNGTAVISASATSICPNTSVTFTLTNNGVGGGGTLKGITWLLNSNTVSTGSTTFTTSTLNNGDRVQCLTSSQKAGCTINLNGSNVITMTVTTLGTPTAPSGSTSLCQGTGSTAYTTSASNATSYTWSLSPSTAGSISGSSTTGTVTWNASYTGSATVSVVANGCSSSSSAASTTVTVSPTVATPTVSGPVSLCQGSAATNYPATAIGATSFSWLLSPSSAAIVTGDDVEWEVAFSGTAILTVSAAGCGGPKTTTVTITVTPDVGTSSAPSGSTTVCQGSAATAYTTSAANATSYTWSLSPSTAGTISGTGTTGTVTWSSSYSGTATVSVVANGCNGSSAAATTSVTVTPTVGTPSAPSGSTTVCQGSAATAYTTSAANATSYTWSLSPSTAGTISGTGTTGTVTWNSSYSGTATVSVVANGCNGPSAAATKSVTVTPTVGVPSAPAGTTTLCQASGSSAYTTSAANATSYNWSISPTSAGTISGTGTTGTVTWAAGFTGPATVSVTASGCSGPSPSASTAVTVNPSVGVAGAPGGSTSLCKGSVPTVYTIGAVSNATGYVWSISPSAAGTISGSGTSATVTWASTYTGAATIGVIAAGCNASSTPTTTVVNIVTLGTLSAIAGPATVKNAGQVSTYSTGATNATGYTWSISPAEAGSIAASGGTAVISWSETYSGTATLTVVANGCNGPSAPASLVVTVYLPLGSGTAFPGTLTIASGTDPGLLTAGSATGGNCNGNYQYQWLTSVNGTTYSNAPGSSTAENYDPGDLTTSTYFERRVVCGSDTAYTNPVEVVIGSGVSASSLNYIRTRTLSKPLVKDTVTADGLTSPYDVLQSTSYFDGLGRPIQTVLMQISPQGNDLVQPRVYDPFGREAIHLLPFVAGSSDGNYKPNALSEVDSFGNIQYPGEQFYYGETKFEPSPLNRVLTEFAAGSSWEGSGHGQSKAYDYNTPQDSIIIWNIAGAQGSLPSMAGYYAGGELYKDIKTDEAGHQTIQYWTKDHQLILEKKQQTGIPGTAYVGWLCSYYVYDEMDNIRFILPPAAVQAVSANSWTVAQTVANGLCFRYEYDGNAHLIIKKAPGVGEVHMVYDDRDRLVMTQDTLLRANKQWLVTVYDSENRPDSIGLMTDNADYDILSYHTNLAAQSAPYPTIQSYPFTLQKQIYYDSYAWVTALNSPVLSATMDTSYNSNQTYFSTGYNSGPVYPVPITPTSITRGLVTGTMQYQIGASQQQFDVDFYDDHGRAIEVQSSNITNGGDKDVLQYNFSGNILRHLLVTHKNGNNAQAHILSSAYTYDAAFRLTGIRDNVDGVQIQVDTLQYNALGQLQKKTLGGGIDSLVYSYNIRGWMTGINKNYISGAVKDYFGMEVAYDKTSSVSTTSYAASQLNGKVAGLIWKSAGDQINRKYDLTYDTAGRLTGAAFLQNPSGSTWNKTAVDFTVDSISYDLNGNIMTMDQHGFKIGSPTGLIDELTYHYLPNSNQVTQVVDAMNDTASTLGDFHYKALADTEYRYDQNGNLKIDSNRRIDSVVYNYLNLVQYVHIRGKGTIQYVYDANGLKEQKIVTDSTYNPARTFTTTYIKSYQYYNDTLQQANFEEGRARYQKKYFLNGDSAWNYYFDYFLKDNMDNIRAILTTQRDTAKYAATMEPGARTTESALFYNIDSTSYAASAVPPGGFPNDLSNPNDSVIMVSGNTHPVGPAIILKVMSGDSVSLGVQSYYVGGTVSTTNSSLPNLLNSLADGLVSLGAGGGEHSTLSTLEGTSPGNPIYSALTSFLPSVDSTPGSKPKAYLNYMLLDNQFNYVPGLSGAIAVGSEGVTTNLATQIKLNHSGYLYVWVSNETENWPVYFDNLSIQTYSGPMLEETHYYPFGLTMAGISDKALKTPYTVNKYKFNAGTELQDQEFSDGTGLEWYETNLRGLDPQIGRFNSPEPLSDFYHTESPYLFASDNPMLFEDPSGGNPVINSVQDLLDYIETNGLNGFDEGFSAYAFGASGNVQNYVFDPNPVVGTHHDLKGVWVHYSGSYDNGVDQDFTHQDLNSAVVGTTFYYAQTLMGKFDDFNDYEKRNKEEDIGLTASGFILNPVGIGQNLIAGRWNPLNKNGAGYFLDESLKFNKINAGVTELSEAAQSAEHIAGYIDKFAKPLGIATAVVSGIQAIDDFRHGNTAKGALHTADAIMGVVGAVGGPIGAAASGVYFVVRLFWPGDD